MGNVMLTFLGTNDYLPCNYLLNGKKVNNVRFVQEALASIFCEGWDKNDKIVIFLTKEAKNKNWIDNGHKDRDGNPLQREGLKRRLEHLKLSPNILTKDVPDGCSEKEIWDIFDIVFSEIDKGDEVIFDITHGFRSLPMLMVVISNYAKILKNIKVNGIYYGAFESLGTVHDVEGMSIKDRNTLIFNLTTFIHLFNWTTAIDNFLVYGDAGYINMLTQEEIRPILKDTRGENEDARYLRQFGFQLEKLTELIRTNREVELIKGFDFNNLRELIARNKESILKPLNPLLERIAGKIKGFSNSDIKNGYAAVEWCIEHSLIQQGYTILQETMITEIVAKYFGEDKIVDKDKRRIVSQAITIRQKGIKKDKWDEFTRSNDEDIDKIIKDINGNFAGIYDSVAQYRNDINHAGLGNNSHKPEDLKSQLRKYYEKLKLRGGIKNV